MGILQHPHNSVSAKVLVQKFEELKKQLTILLQEGLLIAFSGGVDSAFLLWSAEHTRKKQSGTVKLSAFTTLSESMSQQERDDAKKFIVWLGVSHVWRQSLEINRPEYRKNDLNRCYFCKSELFNIGKQLLLENSFRWLAYGYNASDRSDFRPGHQAALENNVLAPLAQVGLTKDEIRSLMRTFQVPLAEKPASPCLSSRVMLGVEITPEKLKNIEELESLLQKKGLRIFRVRHHELEKQKLLRLEVDPSEFSKVLEFRQEFSKKAQQCGYDWVTLDLLGYRMGGGVLLHG